MTQLKPIKPAPETNIIPPANPSSATAEYLSNLKFRFTYALKASAWRLKRQPEDKLFGKKFAKVFFYLVAVVFVYNLAKDGPAMYADRQAKSEWIASGGLERNEPMPVTYIPVLGKVQLASVNSGAVQVASAGDIANLGPLRLADAGGETEKGQQLKDIPISFIGPTLLLANRVVQKQFLNAGKNLSQALGGAIEAAMILWLAVYGFMLMRGLIKTPFEEGVKRMGVVVLAYAAFANPGGVQKRVFEFSTEAPAQLGLIFMDTTPQGLDIAVATLIAKLKGENAVGAFVQSGMNQLLTRALASGKYTGKVQVKMISIVNAVYQVGMFASAKTYREGIGDQGVQSQLYGHALVASTVAFSVFTTAIFFITDISIGLFAALLPLFLVLLVFGKMGQGMLQAWLKVMISLIFTKLFACVVLGVCFQLLILIPGLTLVGDLIGKVTGNAPVSVEMAYYNSVFALISTLWLCIFFLKQVPGYFLAAQSCSARKPVPTSPVGPFAALPLTLGHSRSKRHECIRTKPQHGPRGIRWGDWLGRKDEAEGRKGTTGEQEEKRRLRIPKNLSAQNFFCE